MKKVFVFCIGGTGLRVMKSITMLMASGMDTNGYTVVPIIVDPHDTLGEKKALNTLLEDYCKIFNDSVTDGREMLNPLNGFFNSPMQSLKSLCNQQNDKSEPTAQERPFGSFISVSNIPDDDVNKYLLQTLFSQENLDNKLSVGFKGNPNVGTVVLGKMITDANWFKEFKDHCEDGDRIFIISSIFGGTGASGFPLIVQKIRSAEELPVVRSAIMGAVSVLPYYALEDPGITDSDIDSTSFLTKTKSALAYYQDNIETDYLYYVGEKTMLQTYENNEEEQKDYAHFIELVAATALFDFLRREKQDTIQYMSRAIRQDKESLDLLSLGDGFKDIVKHIADFMYLRLLVQTLPTEKYFPLKKTRGMDRTLYEGSSYKNLDRFIERFYGWYSELANNKRAFAPIAIGTPQNLANWIKGVAMDRIINDSHLLLEMIITSRKDKENTNNRLRQLLKYAYSAIDKYTNII